jgi:hypothetical protein
MPCGWKGADRLAPPTLVSAIFSGISRKILQWLGLCDADRLDAPQNIDFKDVTHKILKDKYLWA